VSGWLAAWSDRGAGRDEPTPRSGRGEPCGKSQPNTSAHDAEGEQRRAAALNQLGDFVPVDAAGSAFGQQPGDPKTRELYHPPLVHEELIAVDGLVTGDLHDGAAVSPRGHLRLVTGGDVR
jgi:hypothetical protein